MNALTRRSFAALAAVALLLTATALTAPSASASIVIDEVLCLGGSLGDEAEPVHVKVYNPGPASAALTGLTITTRDASAGILYTFGAASLGAKQYAVVHLASGVDDLDSSDGVIDLYAGSLGSFAQMDECALYSGAPSPATIRDFVCWTFDGAFVPGAAHDDAEAAGIWTAGDFVTLAEMTASSSIARLPSGRDTNTPADWDYLAFASRRCQIDSTSQNPLQLSPAHGQVLESGIVGFDFVGPAYGEKFRLQVDDDPTFSSPVIDQEFSPASLSASKSPQAAGLPDGVYFWRVLVKPPSEPYLTNAATWVFVVDSGSLASESKARAPTSVSLGVPHVLQHKDSSLVCLWDQQAFGAGGGAASAQNPLGRPGCDPFRFAGQAWDAAHASTAAHVGSCGHCAFYCARACVAMVNHHYGGDLFMDRISYQICNGDLAGPEGDLGHDRGFARPGDTTAALSWALGGLAGITYTAGAGTFDQYKAGLANGPMVAGIPGHVMVVDGWRERSVFGVVYARQVHVLDPWPGSPSGWMLHATWSANNNGFWTLPAGIAANAGIDNEAAVTTDTDGDGLMDFDEQNPRPLCSNANDADTEDDEVNDKQEVQAYTFHEERDHAGHDNDAAPPGFADVDGDGLRSECDCDSDDDSDFDGGEDIDGNGDGGMKGPFETDVFGAPHTLKVFTDKKLYFIGETVKLTGWDFHRTSTYPYDVMTGCPDLVDGQGLAQDGTVSTNVFGRFPWTDIFTCVVPGTNLVAVDVLKDHLYSEPDNWDPWTCWECVSYCFPPSTDLTGVCTARSAAPGTPVTIEYGIVTGYPMQGPAGFYLQDANQPCALRVIGTSSAAIGATVSIKGFTTSVGCEPAVQASAVCEPAVALDPTPYAMIARDLGGASSPRSPGVTSPYGPNNLCLLVSVAARCTSVDQAGGIAYFEDGSTTASATPIAFPVMLGEWVFIAPPVPGVFYTVTGISVCSASGGRAVMIRSPLDLKPEALPTLQ